jgi:glycosyltransferase involved in cell wall biosynthesis
MNIVHVIPGLTRERGGPPMVVQALVHHQVEAGHRVAILTTDQGLRNGEHDVELHPDASLVRAAVRGPDRLAYSPRFRSLVREQLRSCDIVHVHSIFTYPVHVALREAVSAGVPLILRPCGLLHRYSLRRSARVKAVYLTCWGSMVRSSCGAWHYTSEQEATDSWPGDASRQFILPNGIEPEEFAVDREGALRRVAERWPALAGRPFVLFLGRLHPKKRLDVLLSAFLQAAPPEFRLVVAGPDECGLWAGLCDRELSERSQAERVVRMGTIQGSEKADLVAAARLFALPSEHENFGIAALEALAAGTPVLLSTGVDLGREVARAGFGEPVPVHVDEWRERLAAILQFPADDSSNDRRRWVAEHYSWERIAAKLESHYQQLRSPVALSVSRQ